MNVLIILQITDCKEKKEKEVIKKGEEKMEDEITVDTYNSCARIYACT